MNEQPTDVLIDEALAQVSCLIAGLGAASGQAWVGYFERVELSLKSKDIEGAVQARNALPVAGMGGFGEFLESSPQLQKPYRTMCELVAALKLRERYGLVRK